MFLGVRRFFSDGDGCWPTKGLDPEYDSPLTPTLSLFPAPLDAYS